MDKQTRGKKTNANSFGKTFPVFIFGSHLSKLNTLQMNVNPLVTKTGITNNGFMFLFLDFNVKMSIEMISDKNDGKSAYHIHEIADKMVSAKIIKNVLFLLIFLV